MINKQYGIRDGAALAPVPNPGFCIRSFFLFSLNMDNSPLSPEDLAFVRDCIARNEWTFAKTMPKIPHFYIVRNRCTLNNEEFDRFVRLQREFGTPMRWGSYNFPYLIIDGWKYWTMGAPIEETIIINRAEIK